MGKKQELKHWQEVFKTFFKHYTTVSFKKGKLTNEYQGFNIRIPKEMIELIDEDVEMIKEKLDLKGNDMTRNKIILMALMNGLNYEMNEKGRVERSTGLMKSYLNEKETNKLKEKRSR